jgi:AcrR family transcriptional regulator
MTRPRAVRLGDAEAVKQRHICGLFEGPDDAATVLVPFVLDSIGAGERVVHIVQSREGYLKRLGAAIDVSAAVESGQLEVRSWDESYLSGGAFRGARMAAYVRRLLRELHAPGFSATRLIGDMDWAQDGVPGVDELIPYETELNRIVARPLVSVICAYDARRLSSGRIAAILAVHPATFVGGKMQVARGFGQESAPRERILGAASVLFAESGAARTGIDTLIEAAEVAKATFYRQFPTKDALIIAWLQDPRTRWFDRVRTRAEARAATSNDVIPRFFEAIAEWLEIDDFVGCAYLNTAFEISDPSHPASQVIRDYLTEIGRYLEERVAAAGHSDAARLGRELHALVAGSISLAVANRTSVYAIAARDAAVQLLDAAPARDQYGR